MATLSRNVYKASICVYPVQGCIDGLDLLLPCPGDYNYKESICGYTFQGCIDGLDLRLPCSGVYR